MKYPALCLIIGACISACGRGSDSGQLTVEIQKEVEAEIERQIDSLRAAWAGLDAPAVVSFYSKRSRDTYNGERLSYTGLVDWAADGYSGIASTDIGELVDYRIDVLAPDAAVVSWHNSVSEAPTDQHGVARYIAFMTQVWVREGSEWRLLHNHESTLELNKQD